MVTDVYIVYKDPEIVNEIGGTYKLKVSPFFHFIDEDSRKSKKEAWALKNDWGARVAPFAICFDKEKALKAFYSEDCDVIAELIKYLNNE